MAGTGAESLLTRPYAICCSAEGFVVESALPSRRINTGLVSRAVG